MLKRIQSEDQNQMLIQDNVDSALIPLQQSPLIGGNLLKNNSLTSGQNNPINHNLGHAPNFFLIGPPNVQSVVWVTSSDNKVLNVNCSVTCIASIWVN